MADKHSYDVTIDGDTYTVGSETPLTDVQAYQYAKQQHEASTPPLTIAEKNAKARANMAKQNEGRVAPSPVMEFFRGVEEGTTPEDAGMARNLLGAVARNGPGRAMRGAEEIGDGQYKKGAHNVIAGGGTTAAMMFAPEIIANPVTAAAAMMFGAGGDMAGRKVAQMAGGDEDTQNLAGDIGGLAAGVGGAKVGKVIPAGPAIRFVGGELARPGGIQGVIGKGLQGAADLGGEISARAHGPIGDVFAPGTADSAALAATKNAALTDSEKLVSKTIEDQHAEANRTNKRLLEEAALAKKKNTPAKGAAGAKPVDIAQMMRDRLPGVAGQDADVAIPDRGNRPAAAPQGTGQERTVDKPLWEQQRAMEEGEQLTGRPAAEPPPDARGPLPTHRQEGAGGRGQEAPDPQDVANSYAKAKGFPEPKPHTPVKVDPEFAKKVADAYDAMKHDPNDPETKSAYDALAKEVEAQFEHITKQGGLKAEPWTGEGQPYANSKAMMADVRQNNHMFYFPSEAGFGDGAIMDNPLLAKGKNGMPFNDMLRVVYDYLAHAVEGHQFGAHGEENAFLTHLKMLTPEAGRALATETRGQNSFVNFGKHMRNAAGELLKPGDEGYIPVQDRPYAEQKTGLLPDELLPESLRRGPVESTTPDLSKVPTGKNARPGAKDLTQVEDAGGPNASGESAASQEAMNRLAGMKTRGEEFVVKKGNTIRKLVGPEAVDYTPQEGETFGIRAKDGTFRPLSEGEIKTALTGNRKAGAMPIAMRRALFNELNKRSGK